MPLCTTKRRTTINLKMRNNQNCQKIKLYGNQGVQEETFIQTGRMGRDGQPGQSGHTARGWLEDWAVSHLCGYTRRKNWGVRQTTQPRVPVLGNTASKTLTLKTCRGCGSGRNSQPHRRVCWRDAQCPRTYTNPPTWESAPEGPNLFVGSGGSE